METLARFAAQDPLLCATSWWRVDLADEASERAAIERWRELTDGGGEGMVVKPLSWLASDARGLIQPAIKCRGREYLRIIYGPEHTDEDVLARLRERSVGTKRRLAVKELALGLEALARFVEGEPLHRVHECVFGVLALESVPVDPRL
jgi:protein phosphatase